MSNLLTISLLALVLISCQSSSNDKKKDQANTHDTTYVNVEPKTKPIDPADTLPTGFGFYTHATPVEGDQQMAYIQSAFKKDNIVYVDMDDIKFLMGEEAFEAAKKHGGLDTSYMEVDGKDSMTVGLPNDYYILNDSKKIRRVRASKNIITETIYWGEENYYLKPISIDSFCTLFKNDEFDRYRSTPFSVTTRNGELVKIQEVYTP